MELCKYSLTLQKGYLERPYHVVDQGDDVVKLAFVTGSDNGMPHEGAAMHSQRTCMRERNINFTDDNVLGSEGLVFGETAPQFADKRGPSFDSEVCKPSLTSLPTDKNPCQILDDFCSPQEFDRDFYLLVN